MNTPKPPTGGELAAAPCWPSFVSDCGRVTLYLGDCRGVLPLTVDAVVTDPPYGIGKKMADGIGHKWNHDWDNTPADVSILLDLAPIIVIWGGNYYPLPPSRGWLVWHKPDAVPTMANAELAWTNQDRNTRQISWSIAATNAERVGHPTQKPMRVMSWSMEQVSVPDSATVLDPFMGSGTTGIACIRTGRKFIGIEKDPIHFKTAVDRIKRELAQGDLFLANDQAQLPPRITNDSKSSAIGG